MKKTTIKFGKNGKKIKKTFALKDIESFRMFCLKSDIIDYYNNNISKDGTIYDCLDEFEILYRENDETEVKSLNINEMNFRKLLKIRKSYLYLNLSVSDGMFRLFDLYFTEYLKTTTNTLMFVLRKDLREEVENEN